MIHFRLARHRHIHEPEIVESDESDKEDVPEAEPVDRSKKITLGSDSESDTDLSDTEIENRRQILRERMLRQQKEEEV